MCHIAIVARPQDWEPTSWEDAPQSNGELWLDQEDVEEHRASNIICGFNEASIANHGTLWAVLRK